MTNFRKIPRTYLHFDEEEEQATAEKQEWRDCLLVIHFILVLMNDLFMRPGLMVQGLMINAAGALVAKGKW